MSEQKDSGIIKIHGKDYVTVAKRVKDFREKYPEWSIEPEIQSNADEVLFKVSIKDETGRVRAVGHAAEQRDVGTINKTSALENCETSAIGRALACFGHSGTEYASSDEMISAGAKAQHMFEACLTHMETLRLYLSDVANLVDRLDDNDLEAAYEIWTSIPQESQMKLWLATTKGGIFTTEQRAKMRSDEWAEISNAFHGKNQDSAA